MYKRLAKVFYTGIMIRAYRTLLWKIVVIREINFLP
jgi:hypothetical protein